MSFFDRPNAIVDKYLMINNDQSKTGALIACVKSCDFERPLAVTLTMKLRHESHTLDRISASENGRHFLNRLNAKALGSAAKRYGKKLQTFAVLEQNAEGRLHYHMIIDRPQHLSFNEFASLIRDQWWRTDFGYRQVDIQEMYSDGWIDYMMKSRQKNGCLLDAIDWINTTAQLG